MAISSVNSSTLDVIYNTTNTPNTTRPSSSDKEPQPSSIVSLSAQGQQLSRTADSAQTGTIQTPQPVPGQSTAAREAVESPKTQSAEGESMGRTISAYA